MTGSPRTHCRDFIASHNSAYDLHFFFSLESLRLRFSHSEEAGVAVSR